MEEEGLGVEITQNYCNPLQSKFGNTLRQQQHRMVPYPSLETLVDENNNQVFIDTNNNINHHQPTTFKRVDNNILNRKVNSIQMQRFINSTDNRHEEEYDDAIGDHHHTHTIDKDVGGRRGMLNKRLLLSNYIKRMAGDNLLLVDGKEGQGRLKVRSNENMRRIRQLNAAKHAPFKRPHPKDSADDSVKISQVLKHSTSVPPFSTNRTTARKTSTNQRKPYRSVDEGGSVLLTRGRSNDALNDRCERGSINRIPLRSLPGKPGQLGQLGQGSYGGKKLPVCFEPENIYLTYNDDDDDDDNDDDDDDEEEENKDEDDDGDGNDLNDILGRMKQIEVGFFA